MELLSTEGHQWDLSLSITRRAGIVPVITCITRRAGIVPVSLVLPHRGTEPVDGASVNRGAPKRDSNSHSAFTTEIGGGTH